MERTVGQVQPNLENNSSKINTLITTMDKTLDAKAKELVDFKEKHGIKVKLLLHKDLAINFIIRFNCGLYNSDSSIFKLLPSGER